MDTCDAATRNAFLADLSTADETRRSSVCPKRASAKDGHWSTWQEFCATLNLDPYLETKPQKLSFLEVFAVRLRNGTITPSGRPIGSRAVEDYIRSVAEEIASLGAPSLRLDVNGRVVPRLAQLQRAWIKEDPPPKRVKPIPIQLVRHVVHRANYNDPHQAAVADSIIIGFFYMLRPGEHTLERSPDFDHPFRLQDASFARHNTPSVNAATIPLAALPSQTRVYLNFTTQKNGEKDEAITHGTTNDHLLSPVAAVRRRVVHLRQHNAPPNTPLYTVFLPHGHTRPVLASQLTAQLRLSCDQIGPTLGIDRSEISARALRAGGAMALVRARVDLSLVRLMGRWKSDVMLRYIHRSALQTVDLAAQMLQHGEFIIPRHQTLPALPQDQQLLVDTTDPTMFDPSLVPTNLFA